MEILVEQALFAKAGGQPENILNHAFVASLILADIEEPSEQHLVGRELL